VKAMIAPRLEISASVTPVPLIVGADQPPTWRAATLPRASYAVTVMPPLGFCCSMTRFSPS